MLAMRAVLLFLVLALTLKAEVLPEPPPVDRDRSLERLRTLSPALETASEQLDELKAKIPSAVTPEETGEIEAEVDSQRKRVAQLRENFRTLAAGVEEDRYLGRSEEESSWDDSLKDILEPISRSVREMTAGPREMDELRSELGKWQERRDLSQSALQRIQELIPLATTPVVKSELLSAETLWSNRLTEAESQAEVFGQQIEHREESSPTLWQGISSFLEDFWQSRGVNLLLALALMVLIFLLVRHGYRLFRRFSPLHRKGGNNFGARAADLLASALALLLALLAAVLVFYLRGDWLLLALAIVALLGILWASKQALPPYLDQIRLILNIGSVRQGERLIFNNLAWRVDRLNFFCEFRNPELEGGLLRLPVREVMALYSRPSAPKEPWFPTKENDWVILEDTTYGKVVHQTPEQVMVLRLGGSRKTYPTQEFLEANPENLSTGFRISLTFGIDYCHQEISTTQVPTIFKAAIEKRLIEAVEPKQLHSIKVEFANAGASSLDYAILADFTGELASRLKVLERLIQKTCVDVCNKHGWIIPFTQVTIHQAVLPDTTPEEPEDTKPVLP